jgi:hypothetical protein
VIGLRGPDPADGAQGGECVHERLHVGLVDLAVALCERPLLVLGTLQRQCRLTFARYFHDNDFVRFVAEDAQILPLEGIGQHEVQQRRGYADDERLVVEFRIHFVPVGLSKKHACDGTFA